MEEKEITISFTKEEWRAVAASCGVAAHVMMHEPSLKDMMEAVRLSYIMTKVAETLKETEE